jgi:hypothetical protein
MKILLEDKSYYEGTKTAEMDDAVGGDLALLVEYLHAYSVELQQKIQAEGANVYHTIAWQAKVDEMKRIAVKYKKLIEFVQYVDGEETAL